MSVLSRRLADLERLEEGEPPPPEVAILTMDGEALSYSGAPVPGYAAALERATDPARGTAEERIAELERSAPGLRLIVIELVHPRPEEPTA